jgi:hypothetical protein
VNTREDRWKDLKIGVISKREAGEPTAVDNWKKQRLPLPVILLAFAMIAPAKEFRKSWKNRLVRLGVKSMAAVHVLADGASWIWKAVGRVLTGCMQTLDFYHACQHLNKCAQRIHGEGTSEAKAAYKHGRHLLANQGWTGVCQWVAELLDVADEKECERRCKATDRMIIYCNRSLGETQVFSHYFSQNPENRSKRPSWWALDMKNRLVFQAFAQLTVITHVARVETRF